jgi:hypothetical protein
MFNYVFLKTALITPRNHLTSLKNHKTKTRFSPLNKILQSRQNAHNARHCKNFANLGKWGNLGEFFDLNAFKTVFCDNVVIIGLWVLGTL